MPRDYNMYKRRDNIAGCFNSFDLYMNEARDCGASVTAIVKELVAEIN